ncbi:hypothetical protein OF83DRAFT_1087802 [Amylostereum chailletii]|nr:hypothetical protein OF83DRAFT_1087802 [Amylostereum chailletii]
MSSLRSPPLLSPILDMFNNISISDFLVTLLNTSELSGHHVVQDLVTKLPSILQVAQSNPASSASALSWAFSATTAIYCDQITTLTQVETGLHFNAKNATAEKLESFSIRRMDATMESTASELCRLIDNLSEANIELKNRRDNYAARKARQSGTNIIEEEDSEDEYAAEVGIEEELGGGSGGIGSGGSKNTRLKKDCLKAVRRVSIISMLMRSTNQRCNALQSVIGLFLHSNNVPERVIETLAHVGLSLSQAAINEAVNALSTDAFIKIRALARTLLAAYTYDNFDVQMSVAMPTVEKEDDLLHLTSGTLIRLDHGVTLDDLDCSQELWEKSSLIPIGNVPSEFSKRTYKDLKIREDLLAHGPAYFQKFRKLQEATCPEPIEQVPVEKTYQVPLRALDVNESTTQGNIDAILAFLKQGGVGDPGSEGNTGVVDISNHVILFNADLATIEQIQSLQASRSREENPWLRSQYIVAVPGLFHVKMVCADAIWRAFIKPEQSCTDHSSTTHYGGLLQPHDSGKIVMGPGFRRMHNLIQHDGIVRCLDCCHEEILRTKNIPSLEAWAEMGPTWDNVLELSFSVVRRYVANGTFKRDEDPKTGDVDFENSQIHHESYLLYEEITYAMNIGDIG